MQVGSIQSIDEECNDNQSITLSFSSGPLSVGSYLLSKKLVINEQALQKYLDMFAQKSCIQSNWDTIYKENRKKMDTISCDQGCGDGATIQDSYSHTTEDGKTHSGAF
ncbi:MAG: hypothetical protein U5L09_15100 [Bacteroidales bacterium]|nr:hypothetical protein [Bacteroidales bacterium]